MTTIAEILDLQDELTKIDYYTLEDHVVDLSEFVSVVEDEPKQEEQEEVYYIPSREELDEHIAKEHEKEQERIKNELQNQTHGDRCGDCVKAVNSTPNPKPMMLQCVFNGVMVSRFQSICHKFSKRNNDSW